MHLFSPVIGVPGLECAGLKDARLGQGGDYCHVFMASGCVGVAVGDVSGHDAQAVEIRREAEQMILAERAASPGGLGAHMEAVNRQLSARIPAGQFMTLFLALLVPDPRSIHWVSAGHGAVMVFDPERNRFAEVPGSDIPLGVDAAWRFHEHRHRGWSTGALLILGTDGLWETRGPDGRMYGRRRLLATIRKARALPALDIVAAVRDDLLAFRGSIPFTDDITLVVLKAVG